MALGNADSASVQTSDGASGTGTEPVAAAELTGVPLQIDTGTHGRVRSTGLEVDVAWLAAVVKAVIEEGCTGMALSPAQVFDILRLFYPAIALPGVQEGDDIDEAAHRPRLVDCLGQRLEALASRPELRKVGGPLFTKILGNDSEATYRFGPTIHTSILTGTSKAGLSLAMPYGPGRCPACNLSLQVGGADSTCLHCYCPSRNQTVDTRAKFQGNLKLWRMDPEEFWERFLDQAHGQPTLRVFSFGDAPHPEFLVQLAAAAATCNDTRFWVPTLVGYLPTYHAALARLGREPNVCLRHSSLVIGRHPTAARQLPQLDGLTYSVVVRPGDRETWRSTAHLCPASDWRDGSKSVSSCAEAGCDACWRRDVALVAYPLS